MSGENVSKIKTLWLAQCQFKVTGWGIMFICGMVLRCAGTLSNIVTMYSNYTCSCISPFHVLYIEI